MERRGVLWGQGLAMGQGPLHNPPGTPWGWDNPGRARLPVLPGDLGKDPRGCQPRLAWGAPPARGDIEVPYVCRGVSVE